MHEKRIQLGTEANVDSAARHEEVALHLAQEAMRQAQRALVGMFAIPASVGLTIAATVTYLAAFLERCFEVFELSIDQMGSHLGSQVARDGLREPERVVARPDEPGDKTKQARS